MTDADSQFKPATLFTTTINAPIDDVFATIIDLPAYNTWLPRSDVYLGTTAVSETPIRVGTTYIEVSPMATRYGKVLEVEEPGVRSGDVESGGGGSIGVGGGVDDGEGWRGKGGKSAKVVFEQPMRTGPALFILEIGIKVSFWLWEEEEQADESTGIAEVGEVFESMRRRTGGGSRVTVVERRVDVRYPFLQSLMAWWLNIRFDRESRRTMGSMKAYLEKRARSD